MNHEQIGKIAIVIGGFIIIAGIIIYFFGNKLHFLGHLPGDIRVEKENFKLYVPITTMILISILLTLLSYIFRKLF